VPSILEIQDLSVQFERDDGPVPVLEGVTFSVPEGGAFGLVGESGSGKSILLMAILGLLSPPWRITRGRVLFRGEDLLTLPENRLEEIRGKGIALMLSNPRQHLNPVMPAGRQISILLQRHQKLSRKESVEKAIDLLKAVGIPDPHIRYYAFPHELSGGMCQRIIIAMGMANSPDLIMADEPTNGLDVTISIQILDLMRHAVEELGSALLLVSRDLGVVANYCRHVAVMYAGQIVEESPVESFFENPLHPYGRHLLRAAEAARDLEMAGANGHVSRLRAASGAAGCRYAPRCPFSLDACLIQDVDLLEARSGHGVRCLRSEEILSGGLKL
jgi:peptide/nickel transport system ATP-binding protein